LVLTLSGCRSYFDSDCLLGDVASMVDDIVDRLRQDNCKLHVEAVNEIERLRVELKRLVNEVEDLQLRLEVDYD
jgi:hypothetical protein